jgi:RNA polymerase sigma-B factor
VTTLTVDTARTRSDEALDLFAEYRRTRDPEVRNRLVLMHVGLARWLAARYAHRGEPLEDLVQVGSIGLIHAVERFEPERGTKFATFATATIVGEIRRHFRDTTWSLKVPRFLRVLSVHVIQANETLSQRLGRSPTIAEIAAHVGSSEEETLDAMELGGIHGTISLDRPLRIEDTDNTLITLQDEVGTIDAELQRLENYHALRAAMQRLDHRGVMIVYLRFFRGLSQTEVAARLRISQMHVSRLQRKALQRLRVLLAETADEKVGPSG